MASVFKKMSRFQGLLAVLGVSHYVKRVLETKFVHIFSRESMPFKRLFINSFHYWILFALNVGVEAFFFWTNPQYNTSTIALLTFGFLFSEFMNFMCHLTLKGLRGKDNKKGRGVPKGFGFDQVSCANYFWEIMSWVFFSGLSRCWTSYVFLGFSAYQMTVWALEKHHRYRKDIPNYPKNRKAIFPFLI